MQVHHKPRLQSEDVLSLLKRQWDHSIERFCKLVEGEDSQAFSFVPGNHRYVLRLNKSDYGFKKDAYAFDHFYTRGISIPKLIKLGILDDGHFFCITEFIEGPTLQDLGKEDIDAMLPKILDLQRTIANTDIGATNGYGELDLSGNGKATSWHEWLLSHLSKPDFDWDSILNASLIDQSFLNDVFQAFRKLVNKVPNERQLYHGDFGSNNLLTHNRTIVAVLDWDAAGYGDWLFDVASAYYWKNHLLCMSRLANYYEQELHELPNYYDRINCYQLRAALIEMYVQAKRGDADKLNYHIHRCQDLLAELS